MGLSHLYGSLVLITLWKEQPCHQSEWELVFILSIGLYNISSLPQLLSISSMSQKGLENLSA